MIDSDNEDQKNKPTMSGSFENLERILQASGSIYVRVRNRIGRDDLYFLATLAAEKKSRIILRDFDHLTVGTLESIAQLGKGFITFVFD